MSWCISIDQAGSYFLRIWSFFFFPLTHVCFLSPSTQFGPIQNKCPLLARRNVQENSNWLQWNEPDCSAALLCFSLQLVGFSLELVELLVAIFCPRGQLFVEPLLSPANMGWEREGVSWPPTPPRQKIKKTRVPRKSSESPFSSWKLTNSTKTRMCSV